MSETKLKFECRFEVAGSAVVTKNAVECVAVDRDHRQDLTKRAWMSAEMRAELDFRLKESSGNKEGSKPVSSVLLESGSGARLFGLVIGGGAELSEFALHEAIRKHWSAAFEKSRSEQVILDVRGLGMREQRRVIDAFVSLAVLAAWQPEQYGKKAASSKGEKKRKVSVSIVSGLEASEVEERIQAQRRIAEATNGVRTLAEMPISHLKPANYLKHIEGVAKELKTEFKFYDRKTLEKKGAGAFLAVARANPEDTSCGIVQLSYRAGTAKKKGKTLVLVGKGLCFDTGGYNIKTGAFMEGMHRDMTGSAVALETFGALVRARVQHEVHCYLAITENLISPTAFKPNEVVIACEGTSIEVIDTDAEGRMVLSDTLAMARMAHSPDLMIDFATLTGACVRAIDTRRSAVFSNQKALAATAIEAGDESGERVWSFPIGEDYVDKLESEIADIRQIAPHNNADHIYAATFLSHFVGAQTPWLHVDLAADTNKGGLGLVASETTGFGVRFAMRLIEKVLG